jgi:hypothetical protein
MSGFSTAHSIRVSRPDLLLLKTADREVCRAPITVILRNRNDVETPIYFLFENIWGNFDLRKLEISLQIAFFLSI